MVKTKVGFIQILNKGIFRLYNSFSQNRINDTIKSINTLPERIFE